MPIVIALLKILCDCHPLNYSCQLSLWRRVPGLVGPWHHLGPAPWFNYAAWSEGAFTTKRYLLITHQHDFATENHFMFRHKLSFSHSPNRWGMTEDSRERKQMVRGNVWKRESSEKEKTRGDVIITIEQKHLALSFPEPMEFWGEGSWWRGEGSWCIIVHGKEFRKAQKFFFLCQIVLGEKVKTI